MGLLRLTPWTTAILAELAIFAVEVLLMLLNVPAKFWLATFFLLLLLCVGVPLIWHFLARWYRWRMPASLVFVVGVCSFFYRPLQEQNAKEHATESVALWGDAILAAVSRWVHGLTAFEQGVLSTLAAVLLIAALVIPLIYWQISRRPKSDSLSPPSTSPPTARLLPSDAQGQRSTRIIQGAPSADYNDPGAVKANLSSVGDLQRADTLRKYLGKKVEWGGMVKNIEPQADGRVRVTVKYATNRYDYFFALMERTAAVEALRSGKRATVEGVIASVQVNFNYIMTLESAKVADSL